MNGGKITTIEPDNSRMIGLVKEGHNFGLVMDDAVVSLLWFSIWGKVANVVWFACCFCFGQTTRNNIFSYFSRNKKLQVLKDPQIQKGQIHGFILQWHVWPRSFLGPSACFSQVRSWKQIKQLENLWCFVICVSFVLTKSGTKKFPRKKFHSRHQPSGRWLHLSEPKDLEWCHLAKQTRPDVGASSLCIRENPAKQTMLVQHVAKCCRENTSSFPKRDVILLSRSPPSSSMQLWDGTVIMIPMTYLGYVMTHDQGCQVQYILHRCHRGLLPFSFQRDQRGWI